MEMIFFSERYLFSWKALEKNWILIIEAEWNKENNFYRQIKPK